MAYILTGKDDLLTAWAARQIEHIGTPALFGQCVAVGVMTGPHSTDRLMAAIVFHEYQPKFKTCQISVAAADPRWALRGAVRDILAIPFLQYGSNKVWITTPHTNDRIIRLAIALGFVKEATLKDHFGRGSHAVICRMMAKDYERRYLADRQKAA
jgi:RimJ/RimL family protein N-acetyltransferase